MQGNELASGPTTLTIRDVLDLLKYAFILKVSQSFRRTFFLKRIQSHPFFNTWQLAFILDLLQETDLKTSELASVPRATHELWHELKVSLLSNHMISNGCNRGCSGHDTKNSLGPRPLPLDKTKDDSKYVLHRYYFFPGSCGKETTAFCIVWCSTVLIYCETN